MPKRTREWNYARRQRRRLAKGKAYKSKVVPYRSKYRTRTSFKRAVMSVVHKNAETKTVMRGLQNNHPILHNVIACLDDNAFMCDIGTYAEQVNNSTGGARIGHRIYVKGIKVSLNIESQQYRPHVDYWLYLVRNKTNQDVVLDDKQKMYEGISTTIPCDYIDTNKVDVLFCKKFKPRMTNVGTTLTASANGGFNTAQVEGVYPDAFEGTYTQVTNPQIIKKFYVPLNRTIIYRDSEDSAQRVRPASYRYQWVIMGYDNFVSGTGDETYPLGHITMTTKMNFTDV